MYGKSKAIEDAIKRREGYLLRQIEEWAGQIGIAQLELSHRLGTVLLSGPAGSGEAEVRAVRLSGAKLGKQLRDLEGHKHAHNPRPRGRPRKASGIKAYWMKMTPEERAAEMKRRGIVRKKKAA